jgi:putative salt-induced outer membrane protein
MNARHAGAIACHLLSTVAMLALSLPASAQWTGKGEAGVAIANGNSDTRTANAKVAVGHKAGNMEYTLGFAGLYVRTGGDTTARRWESMFQDRYSFGAGHTYWFGGARYEVDHFSGFAHQGVLDTGIGHKFIDTDATKLSSQVGAGYKFWQTLDVPGDKDSSIAGTAALDFSQKLTATTSLTNKFGAEVTSDNNFLQDELALAVKMSDRLALSLGYAVRHNSDPPPGFKKTDTLSTMNLVYEVK